MAGPDRGEIRQIALSGLATSKWIKLRSAIDSSHAPFDRSVANYISIPVL